MENGTTNFPFDLIIRNGRVIDPAYGMDEIADVGIKGSKISCVASNLKGKGREEFDACGCIVMPGLIDSHVHVYQHATPLGVNVDQTCLARGVTTVIDAGSAGMQLIYCTLIIYIHTPPPSPHTHTHTHGWLSYVHIPPFCTFMQNMTFLITSPNLSPL